MENFSFLLFFKNRTQHTFFLARKTFVEGLWGCRNWIKPPSAETIFMYNIEGNVLLFLVLFLIWNWYMVSNRGNIKLNLDEDVSFLSPIFKLYLWNHLSDLNCSKECVINIGSCKQNIHPLSTKLRFLQIHCLDMQIQMHFFNEFSNNNTLPNPYLSIYGFSLSNFESETFYCCHPIIKADSNRYNLITSCSILLNLLKLWSDAGAFFEIFLWEMENLFLFR